MMLLSAASLQRVLILARRRDEPRELGPDEAPLPSLETWHQRFAEYIEGVDLSFDNGAGAFCAIVDVPSDDALAECLGGYPWIVWADVETRELPPIDDNQRQALQRLSQEHEQLIRSLRASRRIDYLENIRQWKELLVQADAIDPNHPFVGGLLASLRHDYGDAGNYLDQELVARRLLDLHTRLVGTDDPALVIDWILLGESCNMQSFPHQQHPEKAKQAETYCRRALSIADRALPPDHEKVRSGLHQLGQFYKNHHRYRRAKPLLERLVALDERVLARVVHRDGAAINLYQENQAIAHLASDLGMLADLDRARRHYSEAEELLRRIIAAWERKADRRSASFHLSLVRWQLADLLQTMRRHADAVDAYDEAIEDMNRFDSLSPPDASPDPRPVASQVSFRLNRAAHRARLLKGGGDALRKLGRTEESEWRYREALHLLESVDVPAFETLDAGARWLVTSAQIQRDWTLAPVLRSYAALLRARGQRREAAQLSRRARAILEAAEASRIQRHPPAEGRGG